MSESWAEPVPVALRSSDGRTRPVELTPTRGPPWRLAFRDGTGPSKTFDADDLFGALTDLRTDLESEGHVLLCAGARPDVMPSGMSRDMGGGRTAYVIEIGRPADPAKTVDIFAPAGPAEVASVSAQRAFVRQWIEALREARP